MILQNTKTDFSYGKIAEFAAYLSDMPNDDTFREFCDSVVNKIGEPSSRSKRKHNYKKLYFKVLYKITFIITERFADCQSLFLDLVNLNFFSQLKNKVPATKSEMMKSKYGPLFDVKSLESQLIFICKDKESCSLSTISI